MPKYTNETYIEKAKDKWRDRFDYSLIKYINSYHKILVKCIKHDLIFEVDPISFIRNYKRSSAGNFCPKCKVNPKMSHDEFIKRGIEKYGDYYDFSKVKFKTTKQNVILICKKHQLEFEIKCRFVTCNGFIILCPMCKKEEIRITPQKIIEDSEEAVFYKVIFKHKSTNLKFLKIGITSYITEIRYNSSQYKDFELEVMEEIIASGKEVIELENKFKLENKEKRFFLPNYIKFSGRTECYIIDEELELKANQIKFIRDALLEKQRGICPLCRREIKLPTLDHFHSKRHNGDGRVRGVVCNSCNRMIGSIENNAVRNGIDFSEIPNFLRECADYASKCHYKFVHPSEVPKREKVMKSEYNRVKKYYFKLYPKRKKMIKKPTYVSESWKELVKETEEYIKNNKK